MQPRAMGNLSALTGTSARSRGSDRSDRYRTGNRARTCRRGSAMTNLVEVANVRVVFHGDRGQTMHAVETVNFELARGVTLGLVGESGCGKSVTALAIMGLLPKASTDVSGRVGFEGTNLLDLTDTAMRDLRGDRLAMIFQEPMTSLNPAYTIGEQIIETLVRHRGLSRA